MGSALEFSVIQSQLKKIRDEESLSENTDAFYYLCLSATVGITAEEIDECITDVSYLLKNKKQGGYDRGIDAVYIDDRQEPKTVHFYNCKYTEKFEKTDNHLPSIEIEKVLGFISSLLEKDENLKDRVNSALYQKAVEIWDLLNEETPRFVIHFCANYYNAFEAKEIKRAYQVFSKLGVAVEYVLIRDLVRFIVTEGKKIINAKLKVIDKNHFEKSDGDIKALIANVDAINLLRILSSDEALRNNAGLTDITKIKKQEICEDAFDENVRVYLRQGPLINRNIKSTALSKERGRFFYFNNGVTITCSEFKYPKAVLGPIVELRDLQIVNGGQTIHALWEAFQNQPMRLREVEILCRIYETSDKKLSTNIAEYTNEKK